MKLSKKRHCFAQNGNRNGKKKQYREQVIKDKEEKKQIAQTMTQEATDILSEIANILNRGLNATEEWEEDYFPIPIPEMAVVMKKSEMQVPVQPFKESEKYKPKYGFWDYFSSSRKCEKIKQAQELYEKDLASWKATKESILSSNKKQQKEYETQVTAAEAKYQEEVELWKERKASYSNGNEEEVINVLEIILLNSQYPEFFPQEFSITYKNTSKIVVVDYVLPCPEELPTLKEVKYILTRDELKESHLPESAVSKMYDDMIYQVALRSIHELFKADMANNVLSIVFNGWVNSIDKATGQEVNACILSVQANREEFQTINLRMVDPKTCFKKLKGVSASKLSSLTPVPPLVQFNQDDSRFISSYGVAESLDTSVNLAAIDWQDFEYLIREVFEKEFSGGNVKVTRASRDGGVDVVAFDPDPIRGGKIIIQAKRYTNTVDVSSVRDLYGTVVNEGANLGILVTTSDYGPDSYGFAKDKPLRLLDGGNLLHLLAKHGHNAKIDLKEAKLLLAEQNNR